MKIAWFCIPAHGHTNPTLGLVREMTAAGHEIRYFSFADFREKIEAAGAKFIPCDGVDIGMDANDGPPGYDSVAWHTAMYEKGCLYSNHRTCACFLFQGVCV